MRCTRYGCDNEARVNSAYCEDHQPSQRTIPRGGGFDLPGAGEDDELDEDDDYKKDETFCECCQLEFHVSVRDARGTAWHEVAPQQTVYPGDDRGSGFVFMPC